MDPDSDPDPAIFVIDLQDASKKLIFNTIFSAYYFLKVHLHHFSKIKSQKVPDPEHWSGDARSALDICRMVGGGCAQRSGHLSHGGGEGESVCWGDARSALDICRMVAEKVSQCVGGMRAALWTSVAWWRRR
jgi:hypothetical protein